jgi:hypothetical protein
MAGNKNLAAAKANKKDEFYTQRVDIENELKHYRSHFAGKVVYCNCDDPYESWFFKYFAMNFNALGLKKLIVTSYDGSSVAGTELAFDGGEGESKAYKIVIDRPLEDYNGDGAVDDDDVRIYLQKFPPEVLVSDDDYKPGDFRSRQCVELLKESDIVVTNPPFSLFREYVAQLMAYGKKFLIIGHQGAIGYKEIFPLIRDNKVWLGFGFKGGAAHFYSRYEDTATAGDHREGMIRVSGVTWFTNLDINKRHEYLDLYKTYSPERYVKFGNFDAINVDYTSDIPADYDGIMGVPVSFMDKYNPEQFKIIGFGSGYLGQSIGIGGIPKDVKAQMKGHSAAGDLYYIDENGKPKVPYARILIRNKQPKKSMI